MRVSSLAAAEEALAGVGALARSRGGGSADQSGASSTPSTARSVRSALLVTGAVVAVVGAGLAAWQRSRQPTVDPWVAATAPPPTT
jgi:hypothetical protein